MCKVEFWEVFNQLKYDTHFYYRHKHVSMLLFFGEMWFSRGAEQKRIRRCARAPDLVFVLVLF